MLIALLLLTLAASAAHFADNAAFLYLYPGPAAFTPLAVALSWLVLPLAAAAAYRSRARAALALYAMLGYAGMLHYLYAPFALVPLRVHATVFAEAVASTLLLLYVVIRMRATKIRAHESR